MSSLKRLSDLPPSFQHWRAFLPPHAILLTQSCSHKSQPTPNDIKQPLFTLIADYWDYHPTEQRSFQDPSNPSAQLLDRMLQAIHVQRSQITLWYVAPCHHLPQTSSPPWCATHLPHWTVPTTIVLSARHAGPLGTQSIPTPTKWISIAHPSELLIHPELKRAAWNSLKQIEAKLRTI